MPRRKDSKAARPEAYSIDFQTRLVVDFLMELHPTPAAADRVLNKLMQQLKYLERFGRTLGYPHARKLYGFRDLFELRVEDETGWYRIFYGFGPRRRDGVTPVALVHATVKHEKNPPEADYRRADVALAEWLASGCPAGIGN